MGGRLRGHDVLVSDADRTTRDVILAEARTHDTSPDLDLSSMAIVICGK